MADFKQPPVVRNKGLLRELHLEWTECALCGSVGWNSQSPENWIGLSLHHISKHPRDDIRGNLVMLCGHGTAGCHGKIEAGDPDWKEALGDLVRKERPDTIEYLDWRLGGLEAAMEWLQRMLFVFSPRMALRESSGLRGAL